ncbi:hypothetical protein [Scytonema sp. NUACC26]|uniref:hypothetical protein n=1 Tax=Scytonema sp. NUACC26 TaxID=3140176 RepID=UPI0034DC535D
MVKNEAVTETTLEAKEWEGELDDADLIAVSAGADGYVTKSFEELGKNIGAYYTDLGQSIGANYTALGKGISDTTKAAFG